VGIVVWVLRKKVEGVYCRSCALAHGRSAQNYTVGLGWYCIFFAPVIAIVNLVAIVQNGSALRQVADRQPALGAAGTLDPGRTVWLRAGMLSPLLLLTMFGGAVIFAVLNPTATVRSVDVGQCLADPGYGDFYFFDVQECAGPHDLEVYLIIDDPVLGSLPNRDRLAEQRCLDAFDGYVGRSYRTSELDYEFFVTIDDRDYRAVCVLLSGDRSPLIGSMAGSGR
jgi:hypothetical protein